MSEAALQRRHVLKRFKRGAAVALFACTPALLCWRCCSCRCAAHWPHVTSWPELWRHCDVMSLNRHPVEDGRDDSGNSSSSSSVILSLEKLSSSCDSAATVEMSASTVSLAEDSDILWKPDYSLYYSGYELADCANSSDILLPLHKTVCCALCRLTLIS